jgi:hypothetical protein
MGAQLFAELHIAWFLKLADQLHGLEQDPLHGERIVRGGPQISVAPFVGRKEWRVAGQVDEDIAARGRPVARRLELEAGARGGAQRREAVDENLEVSQVTRRLGYLALGDHQIGRAEGHDLADLGEQERDREARAELPGGVQRHLRRPVDQTHAGGFEGHGRHVGHLQRCLCDQRGDLRQGLAALLAPAGAFSNVDQGGRRLDAGGLQLLGERQPFLRAADDQPLVGPAGRIDDLADFAAAQVAAGRGLADASQGFGEAGPVECHGAFAVAQNHRLCLAVRHVSALLFIDCGSRPAPRGSGQTSRRL